MEVDQDNSQQTTQFDYDMFVIGGGSGGISAARHAVNAGKKVALADFVKPSPAGSKWGIGGTCVNVGCIPKKMMHYSALLAEARDDLNAQGWDIDKKQTFQWEKLVKAVQQHIKSLNWGYKADLMKLKVKYFNSYATFIDEHTIQLDNGKGKIEKFTAKDIVLATGGRPSYPEIPGAQEFGITSDDLFMLSKAPGKTLVVGASYVALECAGFLTAFGYDTQVMVRSIFLRGFDQQMADRIANHMGEYHTKFIRNATPSKLERADPNGPITVTYSQDGEEKTEEYDTVLFAMGRYAVTAGLNMSNAGLTCEKNGKFKVDDREMIDAKVPHIYAIGDIQYGKLELTPTAIMAGMMLSKRLYSGSKQVMDYTNVATTVFTPLEYGCVGLSEEEAIEKYGKDKLDVFHTSFKPLEWAFNKMIQREGYVKVLVDRETDKVVGFHILSPNAGEITQGLGIALKCGLTKEILDSTVGIHPTIAEECVGLHLTKATDPNATKSGC